MTAKRILQLLVVAAILATSFASTGAALAYSGCASYITVQWGDTLSGLAAACGTTVDAIRAANPGLGWWLYAGQVLYIPTGVTPAPVPSAGGTYTIQWGDTLGEVAVRYGTTLSCLLAANPQIWNINLVYPGQVINLPVGNQPASSGITVVIVNPGVSPVVSGYGHLKVTYGHGLLVRTGPGKDYAEIKSAYVSAVRDSTWDYRKNSATIDANGYVWVEVQLNPLAPYSTGWILVRDTLGKYYTEPNINP